MFVRATVLLSSGLNAELVDCVLVSVDVFVRGTVMFSSGLNVSVGNCVVSVYVFVGGTVMLSSGLNAQWWIVLECRRLCLLVVLLMDVPR